MKTQNGRRWTAEAVRSLGVLVDFNTAADVLGISRSTAYELVKVSAFPLKLVRIGNRWSVRQADLLAFLGL